MACDAFPAARCLILPHELRCGAAMPSPLRLTDQQLTIIESHARPLSWDDRSAFLQTVVELLDGREIGDGAVSLAAREAQRQFFTPPTNVGHGVVKILRGRGR